MNPQDNNPTGGDTAAAGDGSSIAPAVDFTSETSSDGNLSMTDSLASAEDNLTSAGLAAADSGPVAMGLDQIGASDPSATMARPEAPLVPADPVPGSIGSATSGPALTDNTTTTEPATAETTAPVVADAGTIPAGDMSAAAPAGAETATPAAGSIAPVSPEIPGAIPVMNGAAVSNAAAAETPAQAPYNPFATSAADGNGTNVTSAALQPRTEKFSSKSGNGGGSKMMTILFAVLSLILAVTTVIFLVLWQGALNDNKKSEQPTSGTQQPSGNGDEGTGGNSSEVSVLCTKSQEDAAQGITGEERVKLVFANGEIKTVIQGATAYYPDEAAAESAVAGVQMTLALAQALYGANLGEGLIQNGNELSFDMTIDVAKLAESTEPVSGIVDSEVETGEGGEIIDGEMTGSASVTIGGLRVENGAVLNPTQSELVPAFEADGYSCN